MAGNRDGDTEAAKKGWPQQDGDVTLSLSLANSLVTFSACFFFLQFPGVTVVTDANFQSVVFARDNDVFLEVCICPSLVTVSSFIFFFFLVSFQVYSPNCGACLQTRRHMKA
jgi:hypothetical protein